ncbi:MAG: ketopantoate reductase family protein [Myxococcota bacterium]
MGPGAVGTAWGVLLAESGLDVQVFGRGDRLDQVREQGLVAVDRRTGRPRRVRVQTHGALPDLGVYSLILACVRPLHVRAVVQALGPTARSVPTVVASNWALGLDLWEEHGLIAGFPGITAQLREGVCHYSLAPRAAQPHVFGVPIGPPTSAVHEVCAAFTAAGVPSQAHSNMDGWLRHHGAWMAPLNLAVHLCDQDADRLVADRELQTRLLGAIAEGFAVAEAAGHRRTPAWLRVWDAPPAWITLSLLRTLLSTRTMRENVAAMGAAGIDEDRVLAEQIVAEGRRQGRACTTLTALLQAAVAT